MERSQEQLLELIRCALWRTEPSDKLFDESVDWEAVLRLAKEQTLLGVAYAAIERLSPPLSRPARGEMLRLHQRVTLNRQHWGYHVEVLGQLLALLKSRGVEQPVLLKGLGVGLNYPEPALRQCGDIDLYIGDNHYAQACDILCDELGIARYESYEGHHVNFTYKDVVIEIHRYAIPKESVAFGGREFSRWATSQLQGEALRSVSIEGVTLFLPSYDFDFIYIFYHMWRHFLIGGVGLRQMCDWGCYVSAHSDKINRKEIKRLLAIFRLEKSISICATIAVKSLGVSPEKFVGLADTSVCGYDRLLEKIWSGGNFGFYRKGRYVPIHNVLRRKLHNLRFYLVDMLFVFRIDWIYGMRFYALLFEYRIKVSIKEMKGGQL